MPSKNCRTAQIVQYPQFIQSSIQIPRQEWQNFPHNRTPEEAEYILIEQGKIPSGVAVWKQRFAHGGFLTAPLRNAPFFRFDVRGNLLDGLSGK
jgi:hypothetical protein